MERREGDCSRDLMCKKEIPRGIFKIQKKKGKTDRQTWFEQYECTQKEAERGPLSSSDHHLLLATLIWCSLEKAV